MDAAQLDQLEHALGISLPLAYRTMMRAYPIAPDSLAEEFWLLNDPAELIEMNQYYRRDGFFGEPWPAHYFAVGGDGLGNAHFLDLSQTPAPVRFADHETGEFTDLAPDAAAWLPMLHADLAEVAEDQRAMAEARARKRWWQFWIR